jgi:ATP-dependent helicase/nuclease subunit A
MRGAGLAFDFVPLNLSFRSTPDVLSAVDAVFEEPDHARGLTSEPGLPPQRHEAVRRGALGAVDIWPLAAPDEAAEADPWDLPVDLPKPSSPVTRLSERIARTLKRWSEAGRDDLGRPFAPGDAMILVRNRGPLFEAINRALRDAGLPTAGADRLKIGRHIAVLDLMAAARVAVFPRDDLMLAGLLKSPLVGLDDDDLITLAPARQGSLREALSEAAQADPGRFGAADAFIEEIRALAARSGPFAFFARLAGPGGGRRKLIGRLGPEAGDAIDALMAQALAEETRGSGSLVRFIETMARSEAEIRRDLDETAGLVRVLTVHGAKGLEAPVVILADIGKAPETRKLPRLLRLMASDAPDATVLGHVWSPRKGEHPAAALEALEIARLREEEEHRRLLYVAMTRAMDRLIVAGHIGAKGKIDGSWRAMIEAGLAAKGGLVDVPHPLGDETVRRWRQGGGSETGEPASRAGTQAPERPDWIDRPAPAEPGLSPPLRPSRAIDAADAAARPLEDPVVADALAAGAFAHLALEVLPAVPAQRRREAAAALARARGGGLAPERLERLVADILALIDRPDLAGLFGPGSLPEAPVAGEVTLPDGSRRAVAGRIDRLAVTEDAVIVADFKTGAHVPASAAGLAPSHLAQLAIYRTLIGGLFPGRAVRALLIYTASAAVIEPAAGTLDAALMRVTAA